MKNTLEEILMDVRHGRSLQSVFIYANDEPKSALARDLGDCRDNKGKLAKRVFTCLRKNISDTEKTGVGDILVFAQSNKQWLGICLYQKWADQLDKLRSSYLVMKFGRKQPADFHDRLNSVMLLLAFPAASV